MICKISDKLNEIELCDYDIHLSVTFDLDR